MPGLGSERVMVCVSSRAPNALRLLRKAARLADRLDAPWYAVYVQDAAGANGKGRRRDAAAARRLAGPGPPARRRADEFKGPDFARGRRPSSSASTGSRTSWSAGPSGRGIAGCSDRRCSTTCFGPCPGWTSWSWTPIDPACYNGYGPISAEVNYANGRWRGYLVLHGIGGDGGRRAFIRTAGACPRPTRQPRPDRGLRPAEAPRQRHSDHRTDVAGRHAAAHS